VDGLKAAIEDYEGKKLGVKHEKRLDEQSIIEELKSVIYPKTGNNIIDEKLVKYLKYENGKVEIEISFDETDVYKQNVLEEIDEHLKEIDGIDDIEVKVVEY
jgi:metal-sulfur cluster biosynthetic enzyme